MHEVKLRVHSFVYQMIVQSFDNMYVHWITVMIVNVWQVLWIFQNQVSTLVVYPKLSVRMTFQADTKNNGKTLH